MTVALLTLPKLDLGRRLTRGLAIGELTAEVALQRESWQADGVLHGELIVDLRDFADPVAALQAIDAGMQTLDAATPWSPRASARLAARFAAATTRIAGTATT